MEKIEKQKDGNEDPKDKRKNRFGRTDSFGFEHPVLVGDPTVTAGKN
tara:strand:+ start:379 stop:519 length:141 start_codon:yes stop_codon:yes gene_type:complete